MCALIGVRTACRDETEAVVQTVPVGGVESVGVNASRSGEHGSQNRKDGGAVGVEDLSVVGVRQISGVISDTFIPGAE